MKKLALVMAMLMLSTCGLTGCGVINNNNNNTVEGKDKTKTETVYGEYPKFDGDLSKRSCSPVLSIGNTTAKAGGTATVTVSVSGADGKWSSCGLHLVYPETLSIVTKDGGTTVVREDGDATGAAMATIMKEWLHENKTAILLNNKLNSSFYTAIFAGDEGKDGDIVTFYLKIPPDAVSGTVYPVEFLYIEGDLFTNIAKEKEMQQFAFTHYINGTITVE